MASNSNARWRRSSSPTRASRTRRTSWRLAQPDPRLGDEVRSGRLRRRCRSGRSASGIRGEDRRPRAHGGPADARNRVSKGGAKKRTTAKKRDYIRHQRPQGLSAGEGCRLMGLPRSTFYDVPAATVGAVELVAKIVVICDEFETYGYRRVRAELRHQGFVINGKKIRRLMRENGLQPKRRRRYVITTKSRPTAITRVRF